MVKNSTQWLWSLEIEILWEKRLRINIEYVNVGIFTNFILTLQQELSKRMRTKSGWESGKEIIWQGSEDVEDWTDEENQNILVYPIESNAIFITVSFTIYVV